MEPEASVLGDPQLAPVQPGSVFLSCAMGAPRRLPCTGRACTEHLQEY